MSQPSSQQPERDTRSSGALPADVPMVLSVVPDDDPTGTMVVRMMWQGMRLVLARRRPTRRSAPRFVLTDDAHQVLLLGSVAQEAKFETVHFDVPYDTVVQVCAVVWDETVRALATTTPHEALSLAREAVAAAIAEGFDDDPGPF